MMRGDAGNKGSVVGHRLIDLDICIQNNAAGPVDDGYAGEGGCDAVRANSDHLSVEGDVLAFLFVADIGLLVALVDLLGFAAAAVPTIVGLSIIPILGRRRLCDALLAHLVLIFVGDGGRRSDGNLSIVPPTSWEITAIVVVHHDGMWMIAIGVGK